MRLRSFVLLALVACSGSAFAARPVRCDPAGADREAVAAARRAVETACPCDGFASHGAYLRCTRPVLAERRRAGTLSAACQRATRTILARSTCSYGKPRVACCAESARTGGRECRITTASRCRSSARSTQTACTATPFCADTRCDRDGAPPAACPQQLLYTSEGNRLRRFDIDSIRSGTLVEDILIERASLGGLDINGQICALPDGSGGFVAGEDTGQPAVPPGFGVFDAAGRRIGKLTPTFQTELPGAVSNDEPFGCAFDAAGRLFTSDVGNQASGAGNGQLLLWFPPFDRFPGAPGTFPNAERSTNFCKLAIDIPTAGSVATDPEGRVYVTSARSGRVERLRPPFPTSPDASGGCGGRDALGSPVADRVQRETFIEGGRTFSGIVRSPAGGWFVAAVLNGVIEEYDPNGVLLRTIVAPAAGETALPLSAGHPQGMAVDCAGDLYYADLALRIGSGGGIGPGPNGTVRRVPFDICGTPGPPQIVRGGLAFPDGVGVLPGDLEAR